MSSPTPPASSAAQLRREDVMLCGLAMAAEYLKDNEAPGMAANIRKAAKEITALRLVVRDLAEALREIDAVACKHQRGAIGLAQDIARAALQQHASAVASARRER